MLSYKTVVSGIRYKVIVTDEAEAAIEAQLDFINDHTHNEQILKKWHAEARKVCTGLATSYDSHSEYPFITEFDAKQVFF